MSLEPEFSGMREGVVNDGKIAGINEMDIAIDVIRDEFAACGVGA